MSEAPPTPSLALHEWMAVVVIIGFFVSLTVISLANTESIAQPQGELHYLKAQAYEVFVQGAVEAPGSYRVDAGSKVKDIVALAKPLPDADLRRFRGESKAREGQVINIPIREKIEVHVAGAVVHEGKISVPRGTRLEEIGQFVELTANADIAKIQRKRFLKADEKILVPAK